MADTNNVADSSASGEETASAVPSVNEMIADSVSASGNGAHDGATDLEGLHFELVGSAPQPETEQPTATDDTPRKRGRPRKDGTQPGTDRPATKKKAEILADLERAQADLAAERARNDIDKIGELAKSIEFASYLAFGIAANARGPHWKINETEAKDLGKSGALAFAPYAKQMTTHLPWMVFAGQLGAILYKRVEEDKKLIRQFGTIDNPKQ